MGGVPGGREEERVRVTVETLRDSSMGAAVILWIPWESVRNESGDSARIEKMCSAVVSVLKSVNPEERSRSPIDNDWNNPPP